MTHPSPGYEPLPPHVDLPELDHAVIESWRDRKVFQRSLDATAHGPSWIFYEGPPTANGMPGTHHVEARAFKDIFPRYRTMKGYHVPRRAGWDCHGLPVELAVEKELGFTGKPDIEAYGIAEFNAKCRENVQRHVDAFEAMSERMGYWADYEHAYWTMNPDYIESVWWALKTIFDKGLLVEDYRVAPYCPRCGTTLSDHEVAQGYEDVTDPSVYVRFPLTSGPWAGQADLLVWTTTPWTLVSNTAVAVNPAVTYAVARVGDQTIVVAEPLLAKALGEDAEVLATYVGTDLERWTYQRPFEFVELESANFVVLAEYVTTDDGSGLVHQAPAFGADDLAVSRAYDLPVVNPISSDGHFLPEIAQVGGVFFKDADEILVADLKARGLLYRHVPYTHSYPHCWRCHTPLMYYALPSWYIRTTAIKDRLLAENEATNWYPPTIKHGRYGDWLTNNIDWALSRDRYWGTPLPVWRNDADPSRMVCVGSLAELRELSGTDLDDPHRPFVDDVTFTRPGEEGTYRRVPQVIDGWFDSGSMPFAQFGAPYHHKDEFEAAYPADFICEAIDQTRGWFYSLMAVGTLTFDRNAYRNVLCLGHILAEDGRKMSKHLGNILEPIPLMDRHGADALRWFMLCSGSPWSSRRVGHKVLDEIASKIIRTYWSVASFQSLYARANGWTPEAGVAGERTVLDHWALSEVHRLAGEVDDALENFDTARAGKALATYIDDLSNWYVRRSRRRFWDGDPAALATLHESLDVLTRLLAPFIPFVTDRVWAALFAATGSVDSVHLSSWPAADIALVDPALSEQVALVRRLVELGRAARADSKIKTRQPLARALISAPGWEALPEDLKAQVRDELNVVDLARLGDADELVELTVKANFRELGRRFGKRTQSVANAITAADPVALVEAYRRGDATVEVDGETLTISGDEIVVGETPRSGWAVSSDGADTVALDLELTHELRLAGLVREIVRLVQDARKNAGLEVTDRIELWWRVGGSPEPAEAIRTHADLLAREVLAVALQEGAPSTELFSAQDEELGLKIWLRRAPA
ncbi:MAG: isoleucyl-tRNA synthetase [Pseudonocardiales bacterium]|nr:isoleucyl-tRNA synthetase [Pseudonocardiales bacterium]